jgi:hypothetical protein
MLLQLGMLVGLRAAYLEVVVLYGGAPGMHATWLQAVGTSALEQEQYDRSHGQSEACSPACLPAAACTA